MKIKLTLLSLLSNSITLRRDKSNLCSKITITILVISIFLLGCYSIAFFSDSYTAHIASDFQGQFTRGCGLFSHFAPFSEEWCKEKKVEIYKKGFPAVFEDMSKIKKSDYFAI